MKLEGIEEFVEQTAAATVPQKRDPRHGELAKSVESGHNNRRSDNEFRS
jgi:hypothetical protein